MIRILDSRQVGRLFARRTARLSEAEAVVRPILEAVRKRGDRALMEYARQFDALDRRTVRVPPRELVEAAESLSIQFRDAIGIASTNIRAFAAMQLPVSKMRQVAPGLRLGQIVRPLDSIAAYIPAGRYPLPSTLMMTVIPAQVAGVKTISVASPRAVKEVFGTAHLLGVENVFQMGGAQAIAAFAFGTRTVPKADRIVGPGNIYVAAAKKLLAGEVGIDFIAGPTEILIIASEGDPRFLAADMLAQAEHDVDACAILLTTSKRLAIMVAAQIEQQLAVLPTAAVPFAITTGTGEPSPGNSADSAGWPEGGDPSERAWLASASTSTSAPARTWPCSCSADLHRRTASRISTTAKASAAT